MIVLCLVSAIESIAALTIVPGLRFFRRISNTRTGTLHCRRPYLYEVTPTTFGSMFWEWIWSSRFDQQEADYC